MNKKNFIAGISVLALIIIGFTGCAYEVKAVKDTPPEQRASIYLVATANDSACIVKLDGNSLGFAARKKIFDTVIPGTISDKTRDHEVGKSMEVTPGEHKITVSGALIIGRKNYDGTFNFESGKKYKIKLVTPTEYEAMQKPGFEGFLGDLGNIIKESLAGNNIVIMAESKRSGLPREPDWGQKEVWVKSK